MFTRVITTTVQYNEEALKMLEVALKSFYLFNSNFDFKVYCLDNSKELFENYFNEFKSKNLKNLFTFLKLCIKIIKKTFG